MTEAQDGLAPELQDIRPMVGNPVSNRSIWLFGTSLLVAVAVMFTALEGHRAAISEPAINAGGEENGSVIAPSPDLVIPPEYPQAGPPPINAAPVQTAPSSIFVSSNVPVQARRAVAIEPPTAPVLISTPSSVVNNPGALSSAPSAGSPPAATQVVFEAPRTRPAVGGVDGGSDGKEDARVLASRFANPSTTVPKGTIIQAVLETALDSTRAGFARAIVSRDVYSFDGSRVLIAKGSRLIGDYKADLAAGQSRALIQWQRLMRPDGIYINLDSPSADPLGRAGVKGKVNNHFLAKFGGAILQSALDIGVEVAGNRIAGGSGTTIYTPGLYALPGSFQGSNSSIAGPEKVTPTLTVRQGTSVSVFLAKDLDFSSVDQ